MTPRRQPAGGRLAALPGRTRHAQDERLPARMLVQEPGHVVDLRERHGAARLFGQALPLPPPGVLPESAVLRRSPRTWPRMTSQQSSSEVWAATSARE